MHRRHRQHHRISIHALREEGDDTYECFKRRIKPFLSTPSARRATVFTHRMNGYWPFLSTPSARRAT